VLPKPLPFTATVATPTPLLKPPTRVPVQAPPAAPDDAPPPLPTVEEFIAMVDALVLEEELSSKPMVYDMSKFVWDGPIPLCLNHGRATLGSVEAVWLEGGVLRARGVIDRIGFPARIIADSSALGFPWRCSTGVRMADAKVDVLDEHESAIVNGQVVTGVAVARDWRPYELSVVLAPLDTGTAFSVECDDGFISHDCTVIDILNPSDTLLADAPSFADDFGRVFRLPSPDFATCELVAYGARVAVDGLARDAAYRAEVFGDVATLQELLFCLSVDAAGRRASFTLEAVRAGLVTEPTLAAARAALTRTLDAYSVR
jgi:hypothetical protein